MGPEPKPPPPSRVPFPSSSSRSYRFSRAPRRRYWCCATCAVDVREEEMTGHARYHDEMFGLLGQYPRPSSSRTEGAVDREVVLEGTLAEVRRV